MEPRGRRIREGAEDGIAIGPGIQAGRRAVPPGCPGRWRCRLRRPRGCAARVAPFPVVGRGAPHGTGDRRPARILLRRRHARRHDVLRALASRGGLRSRAPLPAIGRPALNPLDVYIWVRNFRCRAGRAVDCGILGAKGNKRRCRIGSLNEQTGRAERTAGFPRMGVAAGLCRRSGGCTGWAT